MNIRKEIIRVTSEYFEDQRDYQKLLNASKEFKSILNAICEQDMDNKEGRKDIEYENGKALGTFWAALCLDDLVRTRQFIRGIDKAIKDKRKNQYIFYTLVQDLLRHLFFRLYLDTEKKILNTLYWK